MKVQRPDTRGRIVEDMVVIDELATFVDDHTKLGRRYGFAAMVWLLVSIALSDLPQHHRRRRR